VPIPHRKKSYEMSLTALDMAGCCEHGNEPSVSALGREFLD